MIIFKKVLNSSFSHTLLLIIGLLLITLTVTYWVVLNYAILPGLEPFSRILGHEIQMLSKDQLVLDDGSVVKFPVSWRNEIYHQLGISLFNADVAQENGLQFARAYTMLSSEIANQLGVESEIRIEITRDYPVIWINTEYSKDIWIRIPLVDVKQGGLSALLRYTILIIFIAVASAWFFFRVQHKPLTQLENAAGSLGKGEIPTPIKESGASDVRSVVRAFNHMVSDIKKLEDDRRLIIAGVSHDLRTPLARLRLISEMLPEEDMSVQESINQEVEECNKILQQFLDFMHTGEEIHKEKTDLNSILTEVIDHHSEYIELLESNLLNEDLIISLDHIAIKRVINNLIMNAQNYGNGWIKVSSGKSTKQAWFQVDDDGPGINLEELDRLFEPFVRGEAARTTTGSGLGLAIVKRIIDSHKGSIFVSQSTKGGCSIRIYLPLI